MHKMIFFRYLCSSQLLFLFLGIAKSQETQNETANSVPTFMQGNEDLFAEDMRLNEKHGRFIRGIADTNYRWPGYPGKGRIPYVIDDSIDSSTRTNIKIAMKIYKRNTCIRFFKRTDEPEYIKIFKGEGCYADIGKLPRHRQPQRVSLGPGCESVGVILHELGHVIGFNHEQNRADRDNHLNIYEENIKEGDKHNFRKLPESENLLLNDFNHNSIMIYSNHAFSKNKKATIMARNGRTLDPSHKKNDLDASDIERVNLLYKCPPVNPVETKVPNPHDFKNLLKQFNLEDLNLDEIFKNVVKTHMVGPYKIRIQNGGQPIKWRFHFKHHVSD